MEKSQVDGILLVNSAEENTSIVLRALEDMPRGQAQRRGQAPSGKAAAPGSQSKAAPVDAIPPAAKPPVCRIDIDYSHALSEEDARSFLHFLE